MIDINGTTIGELITNNAVPIALYALLTTVIIIIMMVIKRNRKKTFIRKKEETINIFGVYKATFQPNEDSFLQNLWEENHRLEKENKAFKKSLKDLSFLKKLSIFSLIVGIFIGLFISNKEKE